MEIAKPTNPEDRLIDLRAAMQTRFDQLVDDAVKSGWTRMEAIVALVELSDNAILTEIANSETQRAIRQAREATKQ